MPTMLAQLRLALTKGFAGRYPGRLRACPYFRDRAKGRRARTTLRDSPLGLATVTLALRTGAENESLKTIR
jgi:hypothetical protein